MTHKMKAFLKAILALFQNLLPKSKEPIKSSTPQPQPKSQTKSESKHKYEEISFIDAPIPSVLEPTPEPEPESHYLWLFDAGHGGIIDGVYQTAGKRSPKWEDGTRLFEGEFNRDIVRRTMKLCNDHGIDCIDIIDSEEDVPLHERPERANVIQDKQDREGFRQCIYISVHANGFKEESANGWEVYTSRGETNSDIFATMLFNKAKELLPHWFTMRKDFRDEDPDKEANFTVLFATIMPSILSENGFMTNKRECDFILSDEGRDIIAQIHFEMILEAEATKPI